jgi:hypothetical protein
MRHIRNGCRVHGLLVDEATATMRLRIGPAVLVASDVLYFVDEGTPCRPSAGMRKQPETARGLVCPSAIDTYLIERARVRGACPMARVCPHAFVSGA